MYQVFQMRQHLFLTVCQTFNCLRNNFHDRFFYLFFSAELLPPKVRSIANSIIICFAFLCGFVIAKTFVDLLESLGQAGTFFLYGGICVVGTLLTALFVPETRGKSIDEIQRFYYKPRAAAARTTITKNPEEEQAENTPLSVIRAQLTSHSNCRH